MKLEARIRSQDGAVRVIDTQHDDYEAARAALEHQVVEGEQLLSIRRIDD